MFLRRDDNESNELNGNGKEGNNTNSNSGSTPSVPTNYNGTRLIMGNQGDGTSTGNAGSGSGHNEYQYEANLAAALRAHPVWRNRIWNVHSNSNLSNPDAPSPLGISSKGSTDDVGVSNTLSTVTNLGANS